MGDGYGVGVEGSVDVNQSCSVAGTRDYVPVSVGGIAVAANGEQGIDLVQNTFAHRKRKRGVHGVVKGSVYEDSSYTKGGIVKAKGEVLRVRSESVGRGPNIICKVEKFGKLCASFDGRRRGWVTEMGFAGLLSITDMKLPRSLCYWLMTRIDLVKERLVVGGTSFRFSCNQVSWVLGLPKGLKPVPSDFDNVVSLSKIIEIEEKYGQVRSGFVPSSGKVVSRIEFAVTPAILSRLMSHFKEDKAEEFKMLFLMAALDMLLCPTQSSRFPKELLPALLCASDARTYNWCGLVLVKLMKSVKRFGERFYTEGFAPGCGGCTLFVANGDVPQESKCGVMMKLRKHVVRIGAVLKAILEPLGCWTWRMERSIPIMREICRVTWMKLSPEMARVK